MTKSELNLIRSGKRISMDELARMIAKGFKEVGENFNGRFVRIEDRIAKVETRLTNVEQNMATKDDIVRLENRFDSLEKTIYSDHGRRLRKIETKLQIA